MSNIQQKGKEGRPHGEPEQKYGEKHDEKRAEDHIEPHPLEDAETIRSGSQTAQDRDHTIRGGDDHTGPMKEFPT